MMEVRPNQSSEVPPQQPERLDAAVQAPPRWAQRLLLGTEAAIAVWAGILVLLLPWTRLWTDNSLLASWPGLHFLINLTFIRGMISGIGLVDIWMGVSDALSLRDIR
jgi:hypothetical protein